MTRDVSTFNQPLRDVLRHVAPENLGLALITLADQIWALQDRIIVLEAVLAKRGIDVHDEIEHFQPDSELRAELDRRAEEMTSRLIAALQGQAPKGG